MPFSWLWVWFRPRRLPRLDHLEVILYTRRGCHLCEAAWEQLRREQRRYGFRLAAVDVDTDPKLIQSHGEHVPVVAVNGKVRFRGAVNPMLWRRLLRAEEGKRADA